MSGFVDFVVARAHEAQEVVRERKPVRRWQGYSAKFVHEYHLADLAKILMAGEDRAEFQTLAQEKSFRVYAIPPILVGALAALETDDIGDVGKRWYQEWDLPGLQDVKSICELTLELATLAKLATTLGSGMLVRESVG